MEKLDLAKMDKPYYNPPATPVLITLENIPYLSVDGRGAPASEAFAAANAAIFGLAYAVKFAAKEAGKDFVVAKLEGQWWWDEKYAGLTAVDVPRDEWIWRLLIRMPDFVTASMVENGRSRAAAKKPAPELIADVRFGTVSEGLCVQMMHLGPYATEPETLEHMRTFMRERGLKENGLHHEIYISDMRKTLPEKARTILRYPVTH